METNTGYELKFKKSKVFTGETGDRTQEVCPARSNKSVQVEGKNPNTK